MSESSSKTWDEMVDRLRNAATEVRAAAERKGSPVVGEDPAAARLKGDVSRLEQSASELLSRLSASVGERRTEIETSFDRERAERNADQLKSSLEDLVDLATSLTSGVAAAASSSLKDAEPELKNAARALEDVVGSATAWVRSVVDPARKQEEGSSTGGSGSPPLDAL